MGMGDLQAGSQHPSNDLPFLAHITETAGNTVGRGTKGGKKVQSKISREKQFSGIPVPGQTEQSKGAAGIAAGYLRSR